MRAFPFSLGRVKQRLSWPIALVVALLQRAPAIRWALADEAMSGLNVAAWVRSAALAAAGALGAVDAYAGASVLVTASPASPLSATAGQPIAGAVFALQPANLTAESWQIVSGLPPGLSFGGQTTAGTFNVSNSAVVLTGTPTNPGTYYLDLVAYEYPSGTGPSASLKYEIDVEPGTTPPVWVNLQPASQSVAAGASVAFQVAASGPAGLTYQWYFNGSPLDGQTDAYLLLTDVTSGEAGSYYCEVSDPFGGGASSAAATLNVVSTSNPGRLINLSVLTLDGPNQMLTLGFYVGGSGTSGMETVLVRGIGPQLALPPINLANTLPDPDATLFMGSTVIDSNTGWGTPAANAAEVTAADSATGAFALTNSSSHDSAFVTALSGGGYTVEVPSAGGNTGNAIGEIYDDTGASYTLATPRLTNVSCLQKVVQGGLLTAGFTIGGSTAETVLIRVSGPTLAVAPFNLSNTMPDPALTVFNSDQAVIASDVGWGGDPVIAAAASLVYAFPFASPTSGDSAVLLTLAPGDYTVQGISASGTAGQALIEVYEVR